MGTYEENIIRPRRLAFSNGLDMKPRRAITNKIKDSIGRVNPVVSFCQLEGLVSIGKFHGVDAVGLSGQGGNTGLETTTLADSINPF